MVMVTPLYAQEPPSPADFRTPDGSYTVMVGGDLSDPYFVNKALIIALEAGLEVETEVVQWLEWLLPRQRPDGGFDRFCGAQTGQWYACMPADADDSMAATTIHLIALAKHNQILSPALLHQANAASAKAQLMLSKLLDPANGLYRVFESQEVFYLMDNAEVYEALMAVGKQTQAYQLGNNIRQHFFSNHRWYPAIPAYETENFYPHVLAHSYLWRGGITDHATAASDMAAWLAEHSQDWLDRKKDGFAWGLVAWNIAALAPAEAGCWRQSIRPWLDDPKIDPSWTVLDAFVDLALEKKNIQPVCTR